MHQAFEDDVPCVLWIIKLDPRGKSELAYRCKQVNYLESRKFGNTEEEFLWAPYSVFTVESVLQSANNSFLDPHIITVSASVDSRLEQEDLPLSPWY
jgi:hypothetical protein